MANVLDTDSSKITLNDLGKATRRGVKKCPKCGTPNGTRGILCKNKVCDAVFKDHHERRTSNLDATRLYGIVKNVYSVRVKDKGPDHRGFVQLPLLREENCLNSVSENSLCFVDSCQRLFDDSILNYHQVENQKTSTICCHIDAAIKSQTAAAPLQIKSDFLAKIDATQEIKNCIWLLLNEKDGPIVQRVTRSVLVVKCQVSPKHPLGYLHFTFGSTRKKEVYDKCYCSCTENDLEESLRPRCIHYYTCICAIASDSRVSKDFQHFINSEFPEKDNGTGDNSTNRTCPKISQKSLHPTMSINPTNKLKRVQSKTEKRAMKKYKRLVPNIFPVEIRVLENEDNNSLSWKFIDWLGTLTELINNTMQLENYGRMNILQFFIPMTFYLEFRSRIPHIYRQKENETIDNYHIMNILHLKEIFDTPEVKLKISKRFVLDTEKGYVEYSEKDNENDRQSNLIFFLNVGESTVDESDNVNNPFIIDWYTNLTRVKNVGELKLQFKYGRKST